MNKKPHILYTIDSITPLAGAERMVVELATRLPAQGFTTEVVALNGSVDDVNARRLSDAGVPVRIIPKRSKLGIRMVREFIAYLQERKPDIVHTHLFAADVWGGYAALRASVPIIISTEHNINNNEGVVKHWLKRRCLEYRDVVIAVSEHVRKYVAKYAPGCEQKLYTIYNGIDVERFTHASAKRQANAEPVIGIVGRLEIQKGHADFFNALAQVKGSYHVRVVGEGAQEFALREQVEQLGLTHRVQFEKTRSDIEQLYAEVDIVAVPSRYEGFGLVAVEAMAAGCAVIASKTDGLKEIVSHNKTGILVDMQQPAQVATEIERLLNDEHFRAQLTTAAQQEVRKRFTIEKMIEQYTTCYTQLLSKQV